MPLFTPHTMAPGTRSKDSKPANGANGKAVDSKADAKAAAHSDSKENVPGKPLGPPPRPSHNGKDTDYFNQQQYTSEPNPFEEQFGNTSGDTPGKTLLPSVAALTSPSSLLPNDTPGWNSLRSGPLSPAMLAGPANSDYFDSNYSRGFPTPNESGLRTGLTPGGGGSMFPAPSPNSSALFNSLLGAQTPNTIDFLKTGMSAKSASSGTNGNAPTSQPIDATTSKSMDLKLPASSTAAANESFSHPDADAANGLFMLAQSNGAQRGAGFAVPQVPTLQVNGSRTSKSSPDMNGDMTSDSDDSSTEPETPKRGTRSRAKKNDRVEKSKSSAAVSKTPNNKRKRGSSPVPLDSPPLSSGKKDKSSMTEEEKRKNFLERNRVAALKCRQRKKQWLNNLQQKVDAYSHDNELLSQNIKALEAQVMQLRTLLVQHKDCPVTVQQGISAQTFMQLASGPDMHYVQAPMGLQPVGPLGPQGVPMMMSTGQAVAAGGQGSTFSGA